MIEITNLSKCFKKDCVLKSINLTLPRYGLVVIKGQSGCGKTTLLNCIAGLLPFDGEIKIDNTPVNSKNDIESSLFRISNIGFIFQDFRLFENETVVENILFPLETLTNINEEKKNIKVQELLKVVGLNGKEKQFVSSLSGGEKQRTCIARSLINDPKIILADEPTGALDDKNSRQIMDILEKVSSNSLIICVTHDENIAKEYGDQIIEMKDGKITNVIYNNHHKHSIYLPIIKNGIKSNKPKISNKFLIKHSLHALSRKKFRNLICTMTTSFGLIGVGLSCCLSSMISTNINEAYSSLIKKDQIMISNKDEKASIIGKYAGSYYEALSLKQKYPEFVLDVGVIYQANFEDFFIDSNELVIQDSSYRNAIRGFTARNINEFEWLDQSKEDFYPKKYPLLEDDEIVLGLTISAIQELCYTLRIERTISSLSNYLLNHDCYLVFDLANESWSYSDQQIVNLKAFCLSNNLLIYHTNHMWNEYMLETRMRFPTNDAINEEDYYPWVMKKIPYLCCRNNIDEFLTYSNKENDFDHYLLEIGTNQFFPLLYKNTDIKDRKRVLFFSNTLNNLSLTNIKHLQKFEDNLVQPILGNTKGYVIYSSSLMMGFSNSALVSFELDQINDAIDIKTNMQLASDETLKLPSTIIEGHFTKTMQNGLNFNVFDGNLVDGEAPKTLDEIAISKSISKLCLKNPIGEILYFAFPFNQLQTNNGKVIEEYKIIPLKVTGVVNSNDYNIYHDFMWPVSFFQSRIGISIFDLKTNTISFSLKDNSKLNETIKKLKKGFPQFNIINPLQDVNDSVNEVCDYISIISLCFSIIAIVTSILLISIVSYIHVFETRKEIGLARCIGVNKKEANKFVFSHSMILCVISFLISCFELFIISIIVSLEMGTSFNLGICFVPCLLMLCVAGVISLLSSLGISLSISKNNPVEIAKY